MGGGARGGTPLSDATLSNAGRIGSNIVQTYAYLGDAGIVFHPYTLDAVQARHAMANGKKKGSGAPPTVKSSPSAVKAPAVKDWRHARDTHSDQVENATLMLAAIAALAMFAIVFILSIGRESVPVVGPHPSIAFYTTVAILVVTLIAAPYGFYRGTLWRNKYRSADRQVDWRRRIVMVTVGALLVVFLLDIFAFLIVDATFKGVSISNLAAPATLAVIVFVVAYFVLRAFYYVQAPGMLYVTVVALMGTLMGAGALNSDPLWYEGSFSGLGITSSNSKTVFNIGLIITGLLIIAFQSFLIDDLKPLVTHGAITQKHLGYISLLLVIAGVFLGLVGVVRWGYSTFTNILHDLFAGGAGAALGLLLMMTYWWIPHFVKWFYWASWTLLAFTVVAVILKIVGHFSLTGIELFGFSVACIWLLLFMSSAQNLVNRVDPSVLQLPENPTAEELRQGVGTVVA